MPDNFRPRMLSSRDNVVQTNVNTVMHNFTGSRELGSSVVTRWTDKYKFAPPADTGAADYIERLLIPEGSRYTWYYNMHPSELMLITLLWQQELDRPVAVVLAMHWPAAQTDPALLWQQARLRPWTRNL